MATLWLPFALVVMFIVLSFIVVAQRRKQIHLESKDNIRMAVVVAALVCGGLCWVVYELIQ